MQSAYIDDGYNEESALPEISGISPAVRVSFRPMTAAEFSNYIQAQEKMTPTEAKTEAARRLQGKLISWDIQNSKGETVPITAENILRLKQPVFSGLWEIATCQRAGSINLDDLSKN